MEAEAKKVVRTREAKAKKAAAEAKKAVAKVKKEAYYFPLVIQLMEVSSTCNWTTDTSIIIILKFRFY